MSGDLAKFVELSIALTIYEKLSVHLTRLGKGVGTSREGRRRAVTGGGRRMLTNDPGNVAASPATPAKLVGKRVTLH